MPNGIACGMHRVLGYTVQMANRKERITLNESVFREGNERMSAWEEHQEAPPTEKLSFLCECADLECRKHVSITMPEYETVRADPMHFAVIPGHEIPDAETVIERYDGYAVVEKHNNVRGIAEETDLRSA